MVDFRYHLVSLISVFLALSVGVILGAGPLQNSMGEALSGQVTGLREDNQELLENNAALAESANKYGEALSSVAPELLADSLAGRKVGLIRAPHVDDASYDAALKSVQAAGATLGTSVTLTDMWVKAEEGAYRSAFASQIRDYLPQLDSTVEADTVLVTALAQLVRAGTSEAHNLTLMDLMTESDSPMLKASGELSDAVDAVVVLTPDQKAPEITDDKSADADAAAQVQYERDLFVKIVEASAAGGATVAAGAANSDEDAVAALRSNNSASTVDSVATPLGELNVAIGLAHALNGETIHVGIDKGATSVIADLLKMPKAEQPAAEQAPAEEAPAGEEPAEEAPGAA